MFKCNECFKSFTRCDILRRHQKIHSKKCEFKCNQCSTSFNRKDNLKRHMKGHSIDIKRRKQIFNGENVSISETKLQINNQTQTNSNAVDKETAPCTSKQSFSRLSHSLKCSICNVTLSSNRSLTGHLRSRKHKTAALNEYIIGEPNITIIQSAFKNRIVSYRVTDSTR